MTIPYDISRCATTDCPHRAYCLRATPGSPKWQSFTAYPGGDDCHGLIDGRERKGE